MIWSATMLAVGSNATARTESWANPPETDIRSNSGSLSMGIFGSFTMSHMDAARKQTCSNRFRKFTCSTVSNGVSTRAR